MLYEAVNPDQHLNAILIEMKDLKSSERRLAKMLNKLPGEPTLRDRFLLEHAHLRARADRLYIVLSDQDAHSPRTTDDSSPPPAA